MDRQSDLLLQDYARELAELIRPLAEEPDNLFERGRRFGLAEAASLLLQEARAFGGDIEKLGLKVLSEVARLPD